MINSKTLKNILSTGAILLAFVLAYFWSQINTSIEKAAYDICKKEYTLVLTRELEILEPEEMAIFNSLREKAKTRWHDCFQVAVFHLFPDKILTPREAEINAKFENGTLKEPMKSFIENIIEETTIMRARDTSD